MTVYPGVMVFDDRDGPHVHFHFSTRFLFVTGWFIHMHMFAYCFLPPRSWKDTIRIITHLSRPD
jgi:hypothetical protein